MIFEYFFRLLGVGIASILYFTGINPFYEDYVLRIETQLNSPITQDIVELAESSFTFRVEYYVSIIVNDSRTRNSRIVNEFRYDESWLINNRPVAEDSIQHVFGTASVTFTDLELGENDRIVLFARARILPDSSFEAATGLPTRILWNYYEPSIRCEYIVQQGRLIEQ